MRRVARVAATVEAHFAVCLVVCFAVAACSSSNASSITNCCIVALANARSNACFCGTVPAGPNESDTVTVSGSSCSVDRTTMVDGGVVTLSTSDGRLPASAAECPGAQSSTGGAGDGGSDAGSDAE
jgi:hypothetical protein